MTSVGSVTRQIAALEITGKKQPASTSTATSTRPLHSKQPSQTNVAKLLSKFAAPNPFPNATTKPAQPSSLRHPTPAGSRQPTPPTVAADANTPSIDIGRYDGGLEKDNEERGERVYGQAAEELALNSSLSR